VTESSTPDTGTEKKAPPQEFLSFLAGTNKGRTASELTASLQELVAAIEATRKAGHLIYKLTIKPVDSAAADDGAVKVTDEITVKMPTHDRPTSIFFVDDACNLVRHNPRQSSLFEN